MKFIVHLIRYIKKVEFLKYQSVSLRVDRDHNNDGKGKGNKNTDGNGDGDK